MFSFITCRKEEGKEDAKNQKTIHDLDQKDTKPATFVYFIILNGVNKKKKINYSNPSTGLIRVHES